MRTRRGGWGGHLQAIGLGGGLWVTIALSLAAGAATLAWEEGPGYRSAVLAHPASGRTGFTLLPPAATGVWFTNHLADRTVARNRVYENGSGVALGDVDGDGRCDLYFCRLEGANVLYRNLGDWRFEDITSAAGVACPDQFSTGAALADVDGDGDLDLLVNGIGAGTRLFLNDGRAAFTEVTGSRLVRRLGSTSLALADIDADGDLDLYVTNYRTDTYRDRPPGLNVEARMVGGKIVVTPEDRFKPVMPRGGSVEVLELGERDFLYLNDGNGRFVPVSWTAGSFLDEDGKPLEGPPLDWGLSVLLRDFDRDRDPDIYVCNDFFQSPDRVWRNEGSRGFRAMPRTSFRNMSLSSMVVAAADINRDGADDLMVADMVSRRAADRHRQRPEMMQGRVELPIHDPEFRPEVPRNTLFLNRGDGTYAEIAQLSGLSATEWTWSLAWMDVDLDGYEDLLVGNGNHHDVQDADVQRDIAQVRDRESPEARLARFPRLHTANLAFRNRGDLSFEEMGAAWGFDLAGVTQGVALGDLDGDGDLDVVLNNLNTAAAVYRNETLAPRVAVRLRGRPPNTRGIGARVEVMGGPAAIQGQEMLCGGRYASSDDTLLVFAAGSSNPPTRIEIQWRSGRTSSVASVQVNRLYEIEEPQGPQSAPVPRMKDETPVPVWFEDASARLGHRHEDRPFDDFARQPLLSHGWSRLGPGVAWVDFLGNGREDLVVGTGAGGRLAILRNLGPEGFRPLDADPEARDLMGLSVLPGQGTNLTLLAVSSSYEAAPGVPSRVVEFRVESGARVARSDTGMELAAGGGPLAVGDVDGDGDLDVFVGGRMVAGRYPEPASSRLYLNTPGGWREDDRNREVLENLGMVSGALIADLDGDSDGDLVAACHWGSLRVFRNEGGRWRDATQELGLGSFRGWWNGVATGDFNGDGRLDLVASNWGRNSRYQEAVPGTVQVWYRDFDGDGIVEAIEARRETEGGISIPWLDYETVSSALPFVRAHMPTFRAYGEAGIERILAPAGVAFAELAVDTWDSMVFLNRGDRFEAKPLPVEAQFAPAFGISVADFDGDGADDLFLAQNFFDVRAEESRYDGGSGLILRGDGLGGFKAVPARHAGFRMVGEQRGSAVADFDADGRPDLAVGQNGLSTTLLRNVGGRPGLRVRWGGPGGPGRAIGATVRAVFAERLGPTRAIHAGAGYESQDALTVVLSSPEPIVAVKVSWPGRGESTVPVSSGTTELTIAVP